MRPTHKLLYLCVLFFFLTAFKTGAQNCINSSQYPSGTITINSFGSTTVTTCNYGGEYSRNSFTAGGNYVINSTGGTGNWITVTDASSTAIVSGTVPLAVTIPSAGIYLINVSQNTACATESACRLVTVIGGCTQSVMNPASTVAVLGNGSTTVSTCNYAGDYNVISYTAAGVYTITSTGGAGNFLTVTDNNNIAIASGASPLVVTIPNVGVYRTHISASTTCSTDATCHTVTINGAIVPNDLCINAILLSVPSGTSGTTINATVESPAPPTCVTSYGQPGVWYKVVGNGNTFGADLCSTSWDSKIFVYRGSCGSWTCVTGDDDYGPICSGLTSASATWCSVPATTYYILVTGYSSASNFSINVTQTVNPFTPTVSISAGTASVCLTSSTSLTASGVGSSASSFVWSTGATTSSIAVTPTAATVYTVVGTATAGCATDTKTIAVGTLTTPIVALSANLGSICPGGSFVTTASGASTYTFNGLPSGTVIATTATLSPIVNTTYTVFGTATNGCKSLLANSPTASVVTLASPTLVVSASPASVCPSITSSLTVTGANTYTWTSPTSNASLVTVNPAATTVYTVSGTGTTICNGIKTFTLTVFPTPTISVNSGTVCAGQVFTMTPSGASTYNYSNGSATVIPTGTLSTYSVSGTSANGCVSTTSAVASVSTVALPVVTVNSGTICNGGYFTILPSGAVSYTFSGGASQVYPTTTTSYSVTGSSSVGCVSLPAVSTVTVFALPNLVIAATPANMQVCSTNPISFTVSGASSYSWNGTTTGATYSAIPASSSSYYVIGVDANGCTAAASAPFTVNPLPPLGFASTSSFVCAGASATITTSGADTYSWTGGITSTNQVVSPSTSTVYTAIGTNTYGCSKTLTLAVNVNTIVMTVSSNTSVCTGKSTQLQAGGVSSYTWNPGNHTFASLSVTPAITSNYSVTGKDSKNCLHTSVVTVSVSPLPNVNASSSASMICLGEAVTLTGTGANTYTWNTTGANTGDSLTITPVLVKTYKYAVTGTDANGCQNMDTVAVTVNACVGLTELSGSNLGMSVYPNPNTGEFTIEFKTGQAKKIDVMDVSGRIVYSTESNDDKTTVNINRFANGVYYVKVRSDNQVEMIKIVKQQ